MVKRLFLAAAIVMLLSAVGANAQGVKGQAALSVYGGYTVGLGSPFEDKEFSISFPGLGSLISPFEGSWILEAGFSGGGSFHYGVAEKFMLGVDVALQQYKQELTTEEWTVLTYTLPATSVSETETKIIITLNGMYALWLNDGGDALFLTAGGAVYGGLGGVLDPEALEDPDKFDEVGTGDVAFGINGGLVLRKMVAESVGLFVMPKIHIAFSDPTAKMFQAVGGLTFAFGGE